MQTKIKLLMVDDEVKFLDSMAKRLEMRGLDVVKASDSIDALEMASRQKFDLAVVDLKMPGLNGQEILEVLKQEDKFLEVIILTGNGSMHSTVECMKLGAFACLSKPYELEKLLGVLRQAYEVTLKKKLVWDQTPVAKSSLLAAGERGLGMLRTMAEPEAAVN